jgi:hypothetical protein
MTTMNDDENPVDLEQFKRRKLTAAQEQLRDTMWQELCALWARSAEEARTWPDNPKGKPLSGNALFIVLQLQLIWLAQSQGADNDLMVDYLLAYALDACKPKGRQRDLIERALRLSLRADKVREATS